MNKNNLLKKLGFPVFLLILYIVVDAINNNLSPAVAILEMIPLTIFVAIVALNAGQTRRSLAKKLVKALQSYNPDKLSLTLMKASTSSILLNNSARESNTAYCKAISLALYGHLEVAGGIMTNVNWAAKEPLHQAMDLNLKSIIAYFSGNIQSGLYYARQAKALVTTSDSAGVNKRLCTYDAYIEIGQILNGTASSEGIRSLEAKLNKLAFIDRLIASWGLMLGYKQLNDLDNFYKMKAFCIQIAPNCASLWRSNKQDLVQQYYDSNK